jgi:hypothetical protein
VTPPAVYLVEGARLAGEDVGMGAEIVGGEDDVVMRPILGHATAFTRLGFLSTDA